LIGPTIGTLSLTAYLGSALYYGCAASATLSIPWVRRYDCDDSADQIYFINSGAGQASIVGETEVQPYASIESTNRVKQYPTLNASSSSGPTALYTQTVQIDGFGLNYYGGPTELNFDSTNTSDLELSPTSILPVDITAGINMSNLYLQNFNLNLTPNEIPQANFTYNFSISTGLGG
jgi:hypothetical protein